MEEEKKVYHEPELRTYGSFTAVTQDAFDDPLGLNDFECYYW